MGWKLPVVMTRVEGLTLQQFVGDAYGSSRRLDQTEKAVREALNPGLLQGFALTFGGFHWILDWRLSERCVGVPLPVNYPVWVFVLHSVVNGYGFSKQIAGKVVRSRLGNGSDDQINIDVGEPSTTERALVARFADADQESVAWDIWCHPGKSFAGPVEEHTTHDLMGEDVVFGLMDELTGFRLDVESPLADQFEATQVLQISRPPGFFARILGRR